MGYGWSSMSHDMSRPDKNEIDHLMISSKWRSLQAIRVIIVADIGSDHFLVTTYIMLKLKATC